MKKIALLALVASIAAFLGAGVAAATGAATHDPSPEMGRGVAEGVTAAEAPTTRLAVWVDGTGPGTYDVRRGKGITNVTNPIDGSFCIRSNVPGLRPQRIVPIVSTEYSQSELNGATAQWRSGRPFCPAGTIEITTFDTATGVPNNTTSFTVIVP